MGLFHAALLAAPVIAFMWTFFGFSLFTAITAVKPRRSRVLVCSFLNFLLFANLLFLMIALGEFKERKLHYISMALFVPLAAGYLFWLLGFLREHAGAIKDNILALFQRKRVES